MFLIIGRTIAQSITNIRRNGLLSVAAVSVLLLSLYMIGTLLIVVLTGNEVLRSIENKINISIYFRSETSEEKILEIKSEIEKFQEIKSVEYISKEKALEDFKKNNADEPAILQSLEEIGDNPLLASLVVKAESPDQYEVISEYANNSGFSQDVSRVNYGRNKIIISRLSNVLEGVEKIGSALAIIFAIVSVLIVFNTVKITIYVHRQEIEVMRLVGASNAFIRLPFVFEGVFYGLASSLLATALLFISVKLIHPYAGLNLTSQSVFDFYLKNAFEIFAIQAAFGIFLGVFSSWIAMRKYLKV